MAGIDFAGQVVIVTGAAGGLGRAYAHALADRGARVVANDVSVDALDEVVHEINQRGGTAVGSHDTVATPEGGAAIVATALTRFGQVDALINNAGFVRDRTFHKLEFDDLRTVLEVHLEASFYVTQPAYRAMRDRRYGRILFTTSIAGLFGQLGQANYGAAKMGIVGLAGVVALEGARHGITANVIAPVAATAPETAPLLGAHAEHFPPETVAALATYLVSPGCDVTHEVFTAAGRHFARAFVGCGTGWSATDTASVSPEQIGAAIDQIRSIETFDVPNNALAELNATINMIRQTD